MNTIHPSAVVDPKATIGKNVTIGPFCVIGEHVSLGDNCKLHSHVVIDGRTTIGEGCEIFPFACLGTRNQDLKFNNEPSELHIGSNNMIREYVTMQPGTKDGGMVTRVGSNSLFMLGVHIAHDCQIGDRVIFANNATLAGHVHVGNHVVIGGLSAVHQWIRIGDFAVIGGMSGVDNDVIPYGRVKGERASLAGLNLVGLERGGMTKENVRKLQKAFNTLFGNEGTFDERLSLAEQDFGDDETVMNIIRFAKQESKFPLCKPKAA
jgi:UDP-N-acetylglucosamine acyltransferase